MTRTLGVTLALLVSLSAALSSVPAAAQDPVVPVAGAEPAGQGVDRVAPVPADKLVSGQVALRLADPAGAERAASELRAGRSAGHSTFGATPGSIAATRSFLASRGLTVASVAGGTLVNFTGSAGAVQAAFNTRLATYRERGTGRRFQAAESPASLPASLASQVVGVIGLTQRPPRRRPASVQAGRAGLSPAAGFLTPSDVRALYDLGASPLGAFDGTGMTVGLLELGIFSNANIAAYDAQYYPGRKLPPVAQPTVANGTLFISSQNPAVDTSAGGEMEAELDIEVIQAFAPGATIKVFEAGQANTDSDVNNAYAAMVGDPTLSSMSTSWGLCETAQGQSETMVLHNILVSTGVPFFAASGDAGAYDCRRPGDPTDNPGSNPYYNSLTVDSPASDPAVVGAGGTTPSFNPPYPPIPGEAAWGSGQQGGGGGNSQYFSRPAWQAGPGTDNASSSGHRQVPDVSLAANPAVGYSVFSADPNGGPPGWEVVGGTSAAAPGWAGAIAIIDQYRTSLSLAPVGPGNPALYAAAQCPQAQAPFHDVTSGNNLFYSAGAAWDFATGWGSPQLGSLAATLAALPTAPLRASYISGHEGPVAGGQILSVTGCGFGSGTAVDFGGTAAAVTRVNSTVLTVSVPPHAAGSVAMHVTVPGQAPVSVPGGYLYDPATVLAITASDRGLWASTNLGQFNALGGILVDAPAVTTGPGFTPLFIGTGQDHNLYVRSYAAGWQALTDSPVYCTNSPGAAIVNGALVVACRGADQALWWASTPLPSSGLPVLAHGAWQTLGGILAAGPAVTGLGGSSAPTFMVLGRDQRIYQRTVGSGGYIQFPWICTGHPALTTYQSTSYFACQGQDRAVWYATYSGGWSGPSSLGGVVIDGPGIAASAGGPQFFVEGGDRAIYSRTLSAGWFKVGGVVNFGAGAAGMN